MSKSKLESVKRLDIRYECRHENNTSCKFLWNLLLFSKIIFSIAILLDIICRLIHYLYFIYLCHVRIICRVNITSERLPIDNKLEFLLLPL